MSDERKPLWPWIVAALFPLPVLYVLSFGPACWLADRNVLDFNTVIRAYPLLCPCVLYGGDYVWSRAVCWYGKIGMSSRIEAEIDMKIYRAELKLTEERVRNRRRWSR